MNPLSSQEMNRLRKAIHFSRRKLQPFREQRRRFLEQYVGGHYGDNGAREKVPVNLLELAVNIYARNLAAKAPQALVTTPYPGLKMQAKKLQLAVNYLARKIRLEQVLRRLVIDALFMMGVAKIGLEQTGMAEADGQRPVGRPFVDRVDIEDFFFDISARTMEECHFVGNDYVLPLAAVRDNPFFNGNGRNKLRADEITDTTETGDERVGTLSRGAESPVETYLDVVRLRDVWLPKDNLIMTLPQEGDGDPIAIHEWDGPTEGPYKYLIFNEVPGQIVPLSPMSLLLDLHDLTNRLFRKMARQAERQKTLLGVSGAATEDGTRIIEANDGEVLRLDHPEGTREYRFGGLEPSTMALVVHMRDLFAYLGGNLNAMGGLAISSQTVGQDRLLNANASMRLAGMQDAVLTCARDILRDLAWYLWTDPLIDLPLTYRVKGLRREITTRFTAADKEGEFLDYNFSVDPYSMQHETPGQRVAMLQQILQTIVMPLMPLLQQNGIGLNVEAMLKTFASYTNLHELEDFLIFQGPPLYGQPGPVGEVPHKAPVTTRNYVRENRPAATQEGKDQVLTAMAMAAGQGGSPGAQLSERAMTFSPTG